MTKPEPKKRGPKPKPKPKPKAAEADPVVIEASGDAEAVIAEIDAALSPVAPVVEALMEGHDERVDAMMADHDEDAASEPSFPTIDGKDPKWAATVAIGSRHIQFTAHPHITPHDVVDLLEAKRIHIPGAVEPILIAARTVTPLKMRPVRVTFTVREPIQQ